MKFKLKQQKRTLHMITVVISIILIVLLVTLLIAPNYLNILSTLLSVMFTLYVFIGNQTDNTIAKIDGVKPIWKILGVNEKVKYFSLDKSKSVLDIVRYFSIIVDKNHKIISINNGKEKDGYSVGDNAIVESEVEYAITAETPNPNEKKQEKHLIVIKGTTIFDDETYFFIGDGLVGGLCLVKGQWKPYSGNWDKDQLYLAESYISEISDNQPPQSHNNDNILINICWLIFALLAIIIITNYSSIPSKPLPLVSIILISSLITYFAFNRS